MSLRLSSNFSEANLLLNLPVEVNYYKDIEEGIIIQIPTFRDLQNIKILSFIMFLQNPDYWNSNGYFKASKISTAAIAYIHFFKAQEVFQKIFPCLEIKENKFFFKDKILSDEIFQDMVDIVLIGCGYKSFANETPKMQDSVLSEFQKRQAEYEAKLKKTKAKSEDKYKIDKVLLGIVAYYPQYKLTDLAQLNGYTINALYAEVRQRQYRFIEDIGRGNGLVPKENKYQPLY